MPQQNNTFWYDTPRDMLAKLDREIKSLQAIGRLDNHRKADTVLNAAITAWQISDWVKASITDQQRMRISIACGGCTVDNRFLDKYFRANPNVHFCRQLATAGKHASVRDHHDHYVRTLVALVFDFEAELPSLEWMISVDHNGTSVPVKEVLGGAYDFWCHFLDLMEGVSPSP
ncbi:hypothetical protein L6Q82_29585 [Burkholderia cenocepacia]|uniref:hypothetical protein n=1 Tax=Burkholderia cenocepacia TaxID=95486 RepID=UPI001F268ED9|nr:hypothetical protein [Burkholderia cenocepacia]MCG0582129.1 hypothetical protein [Burkholderia cenocepacia]